MPKMHSGRLCWFRQCVQRRFNKIAIQGTPQMAVDKEALICLSRVYSYYFKCNFPLFYVYPALTRYLSILFLNILTLQVLACTHSSDNLFHTLMVLCENENFLTSNLLCFYTRVKLCPLVILISLIWKKRLESIEEQCHPQSDAPDITRYQTMRASQVDMAPPDQGQHGVKAHLH